MISNEYTHYDLHLGNVLLHKPSSYINMEYIYPDGNKVTIKSSYVVKIIDYGRNHCPVSKLYHQYLCFGKDRAECGPTHNIACGIEKGHNFFLEKPTGKKGLAIYEQHLIAYHYLNTLVKNYSCDLRLAHILRLYAINKNNSHVFKKKFLWEETKTLLEKIYYSISSKDMMTDYGTPEFTCKPGKDIIYNVNEMAEKLKNFINSPKYQEKAEKYFKNEKPLGTMIIHLDKSKEIEYIPM
jgi:hypothetical protein